MVKLLSSMYKIVCLSSLCIRLTLVVELIRKTNADRFRCLDDILSSLSRK